MQELDKNRRLKITQHAFECAQQFNVTVNKLVFMFWNSSKDVTPPNAGKYGDKPTIYRRYGTFVMPVGVCDDKRTGKPIYLLLTVYDQRLDLPGKAFKNGLT